MFNLLSSLKDYVKDLFDPFHLPSQFYDTEEEKILHISDTPDSIYPYIFRAIDRIKPQYIIHTGDLADNIKIGAGGSRIRYRERVKTLIEGLEKREWAEIFVVPGNHDSIEILDDLIERITIKTGGTVLKLAGLEVGIAHYPDKLPDHSAVYLFGHNKENITRDGMYLNGLVNMNLILLPSLEVANIPYPLKTEMERKYRRLKLP